MSLKPAVASEPGFHHNFKKTNRQRCHQSDVMRADDRGLARRFVGQPGVYHVMDGAISTFESSPMRKARRAAEDELETIVLAKAQLHKRHMVARDFGQRLRD